jgi:hypothetical protein
LGRDGIGGTGRERERERVGGEGKEEEGATKAIRKTRRPMAVMGAATVVVGPTTRCCSVNMMLWW